MSFADLLLMAVFEVLGGDALFFSPRGFFT